MTFIRQLLKDPTYFVKKFHFTPQKKSPPLKSPVQGKYRENSKSPVQGKCRKNSKSPVQGKYRKNSKSPVQGKFRKKSKSPVPGTMGWR